MPLTSAIKNLFYTKSLPSLGPEKRPDALNLDSCQTKIQRALKSADKHQKKLVQSALLLWHDHLEDSHNISQSIDSSDGSFLHSLMHRREPDYPNAKYWINRTGTHKAYPEITRRAQVLLKNTSHENFFHSGWSAIGMVDAVEKSAQNTNIYSILQELQQVEMEVFLEMI